jgi:hypothetical protein
VRSITPRELKRACEVFDAHEGREFAYRVATFLLRKWWGRPAEMADALAVLLLVWNEAFYRYGRFSLDALRKCLQVEWARIDAFRSRRITSFSDRDHARAKSLFEALLLALRGVPRKGRPRRSPVAVAKALHMLAPGFFPIWDGAIARAYGCHYAGDPSSAYVRFCTRIAAIADELEPAIPASPKTIVKRIDEYNYVKYTKRWRRRQTPNATAGRADALRR